MTFKNLNEQETLSVAEYALEILAMQQGISSSAFLKQVSTHSLYQKFIQQFSLPDDHQMLAAFLHSSFINEFSFLNFSSNERAEFLGDSLLGLYVGKKIYESHPQMNEGQMSRLKSSLVNEDSLYELAKLIHLDQLMILGKGELKRQGHQRPSILSDAFEAILGVLVEKFSMEDAFFFLDKIIDLYNLHHEVPFFSAERIQSFDAKTKLQEMTMALYKEHPSYEFVQRDNQSFDVDVYICQKKIISMNHISKKKATRILAEKILNNKLYLLSEGE